MNHRLGAQTTEFWERERGQENCGLGGQGAGSGLGVPEKGQSIRGGGGAAGAWAGGPVP